MRRCLAGRQAGEVALAEHEQDPEIWEAPLRAAGAGDDANIAASAQALMALLDTAGSRSGRYVITVTGSEGVQVGDRNTQHNNFGPPPPRR